MRVEEVSRPVRTGKGVWNYDLYDYWKKKLHYYENERTVRENAWKQKNGIAVSEKAITIAIATQRRPCTTFPTSIFHCPCFPAHTNFIYLFNIFFIF